eukprot:5523337-Prymnesium_polylepis.1
MHWCKTCCQGRVRARDLVKVRQRPVQFWLCSERCAEFWSEHRYPWPTTPARQLRYAKWLKQSATQTLTFRDQAAVPGTGRVSIMIHESVMQIRKARVMTHGQILYDQCVRQIKNKKADPASSNQHGASRDDA